ncbi:MAG TPA: ABC transporter ATP-binding protein [Planctomycetota bacterium]|nr:ABC transporter ATP-binding protein [Planctomycetota bacterium]
MAPLAELLEVSKVFDGRRALAALSLEVRRGEVLGLLGPNGAGKTTAVRILCGLLEPTSGSARIAGFDVRSQALEARRCMAFVPDGAPLYANLTPLQHLQLVGRLHGRGEEVIEREARRLLAGLGLEARIDDPVGSFSRGMRQKTALACALLPRPPLLVLDEPLEGLDAPTTAVVKEVLRAWARRGGAVLYTSHLLDVVERVCDRMAILDRGELVALGTLDELRARSGQDGTLEQVFRSVTRAEDPSLKALEILGSGELATLPPSA